MPNLVDGETDFYGSRQSYIETALAKSMESMVDIDLERVPQDITVTFQNSAEAGLLSPEKIHSLYYRTYEERYELVRTFDSLIVAGSPLLLCNNLDFISLISNINVPTIFVMLFPLIEIEFYCGSQFRDYIARCVELWINSCSCAVVPSEYSRTELLSNCHITSPIYRIPHCINLQEFRAENFPNNRKIERNVVSTSRFSSFSKHKNIDDLLAAWKYVKSHVPNATLTLIGAAPTASFYTRQMLSQDGLVITGEISDFERNKILQKSRVFVLPSAIEAFGYSFLEALATGVPIIGIDSTATPELIRHNENGILVEAQRLPRVVGESSGYYLKPKVGDLVSAITRILTDDSLYAKLHQGCLTNLTKFGRTNFTKSYKSLLTSICR